MPATSSMARDAGIAETTESQPEIDESLIQIPTSNAITAVEDDVQEDDQEDPTEPAQQQPTGKKKSKRKGLANRGPTALPKNRGSGFEEYFADPPMTVEEAMQEREWIYASDLPFETRMQSCIQRFRSRRRLQHPREFWFNEYLFLGGVDTSEAAYNGCDPKELKKLTPTQRQEATSTGVIYEGSEGGERFYNGDKTKWTVDFMGVAAGFLSVRIIPLTGLQTKPMMEAIDMIENFLRYVLQHDVCPEYEGDVKEAIKLCATAKDEWPLLNSLQTSLPGLFNLAATELFSKVELDTWAFHLFQVPEGYDAKSIFFSALMMFEDEKVVDYLTGDSVKVLRQYECTLEVTKISLPTDETVDRFKRLAISPSEGHKKIKLLPIGKLTLKPATIEDGWVYPDVPHPLEGQEIDLYFEQDILLNLKPGMKMTMEIVEVGADVRFVRRISKIVPSFYTFLPQELMRYFKPPRENDRPAPSVRNPTAGEDEAAED